MEFREILSHYPLQSPESTTLFRSILIAAFHASAHLPFFEQQQWLEDWVMEFLDAWGFRTRSTPWSSKLLKDVNYQEWTVQ